MHSAFTAGKISSPHVAERARTLEPLQASYALHSPDARIGADHRSNISERPDIFPTRSLLLSQAKARGESHMQQHTYGPICRERDSRVSMTPFSAIRGNLQ